MKKSKHEFILIQRKQDSEAIIRFYQLEN